VVMTHIVSRWCTCLAPLYSFVSTCSTFIFSRLRATSHTRLRARDHDTSSTLIGGKGGAGPSSLHTTIWGTNGVCECKMDVKVHRGSYVASNGLCFMITWPIFKNHHLEVGLTQNQETMALWTLPTVDLFYFCHMWEPAWIETHSNSIWLKAWLQVTSHYTWGSVTTLHDFGGVLGRSLDAFFELSQFHGHGSWLVCEVALKDALPSPTPPRPLYQLSLQY
jgi:hypothetical protein